MLRCGPLDAGSAMLKKTMMIHNSNRFNTAIIVTYLRFSLNLVAYYDCCILNKLEKHTKNLW